MTAEAQKSRSMSKDLMVYVCLLVLAGIQFVIAYQSISPGQMFTRMLVVAVIEASLALLFFMHLADNRGLLWFVVIFNVFVLLAMQYGWTDAFRLSSGVPWAK
jgi:caa(3)-type oxidase subunit IV